MAQLGYVLVGSWPAATSTEPDIFDPHVVCKLLPPGRLRHPPGTRHFARGFKLSAASCLCHGCSELLC